MGSSSWADRSSFLWCICPKVVVENTRRSGTFCYSKVFSLFNFIQSHSPLQHHHTERKGHHNSLSFSQVPSKVTWIPIQSPIDDSSAVVQFFAYYKALLAPY